MEREAIRRAIPQMRTLKFNGYVHDKNKSITNVFMNNWSELDEHLDKYNLLKDLKGRLLKWFNILIKKNLKPKKMTEQWMNAEKHYSGDHSRCEKHGQSNDWTGKNCKEAKYQLHKFLKETSETFEKVGSRYSTNTNESFNALRAKFADKSTSWEGSYRGRLTASILQKNQHYNWIFTARKRLNLPPLDKDAKKDLINIFSSRINEKIKQRSPLYQELRNRNRSKKY